MGIFTAGATNKFYGAQFWNLWDLLNSILDHNFSAGARTAW
jgi:hypothetical protein